MLIGSYAFAQQKAVTETGEEVILYDDGTWKYLKDQDKDRGRIPTNKMVYTKSEASTFLVKSNIFSIGYYIDPKLWTFGKGENNPEAEYEFKYKEGELYGMVVNEEIEIPLKNLRKIAFDNAQGVAPDAEVVFEEYRMVNEQKVLVMEIHGTIEGIKFAYFGYYFSNENGTCQFITYTSQALMKKYKSAAENLLNGMVLLETE